MNVNGGFYRSIDDTVIWTPQTTAEKFRMIEPGEEGVVSFGFFTTEFDYRTSAENPSMTMEVAARARRVGLAR